MPPRALGRPRALTLPSVQHLLRMALISRPPLLLLALRLDFERKCSDGIAAGASFVVLYGVRVWFIEHTPKLRDGASLTPSDSDRVGLVLQFVSGFEFKARIHCIEALGVAYCFCHEHLPVAAAAQQQQQQQQQQHQQQQQQQQWCHQQLQHPPPQWQPGQQQPWQQVRQQLHQQQWQRQQQQQQQQAQPRRHRSPSTLRAQARRCDAFFAAKDAARASASPASAGLPPARREQRQSHSGKMKCLPWESQAMTRWYHFIASTLAAYLWRLLLRRCDRKLHLGSNSWLSGVPSPAVPGGG